MCQKYKPKPRVEDILDTVNPYQFAFVNNDEDEKWDGACPCAVIVGEGFLVDVHCWRKCCYDCQYSGVHVSGTISDTDKRMIGHHIINNNPWSEQTDWNLVIT